MQTIIIDTHKKINVKAAKSKVLYQGLSKKFSLSTSVREITLPNF